MKMKLSNRISIMVLAVLGVIAGIFAALETFGIDSFGVLNSLVVGAGGFRIIVLIVILILLAAIALICVQAFLIGLHNGDVKKVRVITLKGTKDDVVLVAQETLDELVKGTIGDPEGVSDIKVTTGYHDKRLDVLIDIAVESTIDIPFVTKEMQNRVRTQLIEINGIELSSVDVKISSIKIPEGTVVPPYAKPSKEEAKAEEEVKEEETAENTEETEAEAIVSEEAIEETFETEEIPEEEIAAEAPVIEAEAPADEEAAPEEAEEIEEVSGAAENEIEEAEDEKEALTEDVFEEIPKKSEPEVWTSFVTEEAELEFGEEKEQE